ncbi:MAG: hypothetical protein GWP03_05665 [Proteobacteria bacterium]|nr:hypothetical protein [Pseudomonadota bacterium]
MYQARDNYPLYARHPRKF